MKYIKKNTQDLEIGDRFAFVEKPADYAVIAQGPEFFAWVGPTGGLPNVSPHRPVFLEIKNKVKDFAVGEKFWHRGACFEVLCVGEKHAFVRNTFAKAFVEKGYETLFNLEIECSAVQF